MRAAAELKRRRRKKVQRTGRQTTFFDYVSATNPGYRWYRHCQLLADTLQRVVDGEIKRLIVNMPPQFGKSELVSRSLPGYFLTRNPTSHVVLTSYGAELANDLSIDARDRYRESGASLHRDARAVRRWRTPQGGGMVASGIGGAITGRTSNLTIIDDPYKDDEEASSAKHRAKVERKWDSVITTRLSEDAPVVLMATRWDKRDLTGFVLEREKGEAPEHWHILSLPAISEEVPQAFPDTCTVIPDFRTEPGLPLCPEIKSLDYLLGMRSRILPYYWHSIWQQRPTDPDGTKFKRAWFSDDIYIDRKQLPQMVWRIRAWDKAGTEGGGDWTVGVLIARDRDGRYYIEDVVRGQWDDLGVDKMIYETAQRDDRLTGYGQLAPRVEIFFEQEPGSGGKQSAALSIRSLEGYPAFAEPPVGNKVVRAIPLATYIKSGNVRMVRAPWNEAFVDELCEFRDEDSQSDQVDAASHAFMHLALRHGDSLHPHRGT